MLVITSVSSVSVSQESECSVSRREVNFADVLNDVVADISEGSR